MKLSRLVRNHSIPASVVGLAAVVSVPAAAAIGLAIYGARHWIHHNERNPPPEMADRLAPPERPRRRRR